MGEHTLGKHLVLRRYLEAWYPILGKYNDNIAFIDGFAGPGEYVGGEEGSPVIAMKAFANHRSTIRATVNFWFIEADRRRAEHLERVVAPHTEALGARAKVQVSHGRFDETLGGLLSSIAEQKRHLVPTVVMIDPFGVSHTPMSIIEKILLNPKSEVYISFMSEWINRFNEEPGFEQHLDALFGSPDWRGVSAIQDPRARKNFFFELYKRCLRNAGAKYVLHFELYRGNELVYAIFFATGSDLGCEKMKEAIWKVDPINGSRFVPGNEAAMDLFTEDTTRFEPEIFAQLLNRGWVAIEELEAWARTDKTGYPCTHLKRALRALERVNSIEIENGTRNKKMSYPPGTRLRIVSGDR